MNYFKLLYKNAFRNRFRTLLTVLGMAVAVLAFLFLRTVVTVWNSTVSAAAEDRLVTRNKISFTLPVPRTYFNRIVDSVPGVSDVTYANWFGGVYPKDEKSFFAQFAIDGDTYFKVYPDFVVSPEQMSEWKADPSGAIVGDLLAQKYGWKIGDKVTLTGTIFPGDWTFNIRALYGVTNKSFDRYSMMFHWKYLNEGIPEVRREQAGWFAIRVKDPTQGPTVGKAIDQLFASSEAETLTESERAFNLGFLSMYASVLTAMDIVSVVILLIMTMIVGNTIAMGVRERTQEYGVLRAMGFVPAHLAFMVFGETLVIAAVGGLLGILSAVPLVNGFGKFVEDNFGNFFPYFRLEAENVVLAGALAIGVGLISALMPSIQVTRLNVVNALRRVG